MTESRFDNRTIVITGASGGIGQAVARRFGREKARILLHANKNVAAVTNLADEIRLSGGTAEVIEADFSRPEAPSEFVQSVFRLTDRVDIWVNGAGVDLMHPSMSGAPFEKKMRKIFEVDVFATTQMSREIGRHMFEHDGGTIFFFSWNGVHFGWKSETAQLYGGAKGAVLGFSRSLAECLAPKVRICCLTLGWIKTRWGDKASDDYQRAVRDDSLKNRWGTANEVAETVVFLSRDEAEFVDGIDLRLDGGKRGTK